MDWIRLGWVELRYVWFVELGGVWLGWVKFGLCLVELSWFSQFSLYTVKTTDRLAQKAWLILSVLCCALPCSALPCPASL